jgi:hypothetical protein
VLPSLAPVAADCGGDETWPRSVELNDKEEARRKINNKTGEHKTPSQVCFASLIRSAAIDRHLKGLLTSAAKRHVFTPSLSHKLIASLHISYLS